LTVLGIAKLHLVAEALKSREHASVEKALGKEIALLIRAALESK